jgi:eukaryotic-like serine/threonine-protein kinase
MWKKSKLILRSSLDIFLGKKSRSREVSRSPSQAETVDSLEPFPSARLHHRPQAIAQSLSTGELLCGRFEIRKFLSSGGMGEVYEAWDCDLHERIAVKRIRPEIAANPFIIERFKREVKQARVISHQNVCRVYEVFSHTQPSGSRIWFLTMELLDGQTLSAYLERSGPFHSKFALEIIEQLIAGLAAAHDHGIVHRDFKSSNVMLVREEEDKTRAVITDFGLAVNVSKEVHYLIDRGGGGTPQYMAPEQEKEENVGLPADQYALGVVMCEMLTGRLPSRPDSKGRVLLPSAHLSPRLEAVIRRCLRVNPEGRFENMRDILPALKPRTRSKGIWIGVAAFISAIPLISAAIISITTDRARVQVQNVSQLTPDTDLTSRPSLSRDGHFIAYSSDRAEAGNLDIWAQSLPSGKPRRLTTDPNQDVDPNISPDGSSVVFRSERSGGGIYVINTSGMGERLLAPGGRNPRFSPDGRSVVYWVGDPDDTVASGKLFLLSIADGSPVRIGEGFKDARLPVWSPDGQYILFTGCRGEQPLPACSEWWVIRPDGSVVQNTGSLALLRQQNIQLIEGPGSWYQDMVIFSGRRETVTRLWALTISHTGLKAEGKPMQLTSGDVREVAPSLADNGTIAFEHLTGALHVWRIAGASSTKPASLTKLTQDALLDLCPYISHNGRWLTSSRGIGRPHDIWIRDMQSGNESLFLASSGDKLSPVVDESGKTVVFEERAAGIPSIHVMTQWQPPRLVCNACAKPTGWFIEGRTVLYSEGTPSKIKMSDILTGESKIVLESNEYSLGDATWSPETGYLLFTASRTGERKQVFAVSLSKTTQSRVGSWIPISEELAFSERPQWSGDGRTIFYISDRDGFSCIWKKRFEPASQSSMGAPVAVMHYHNPRFSLGAVGDRSFNLSVSGNSIFVNVGEINTSIWIGALKRRGLLSTLTYWKE